MNSEISKIYDIFGSMLGRPVQHVKLGHGSFLTIGFGRDIEIEIMKRGKKEIKTRPEWYLWTYMCAWQLQVHGKSIATSKDEREEIENSLLLLRNKNLLRATVLNDLYDMKFEFDDDIILSLYSNNSESDNVQWRFYTPGKKVLVAGPLNQLSYHLSSYNFGY